ncbi:acetyl-CoA carboxylase carboxyl transferase subunit beta [Candidatus Poribacteria bacterium]|nr:acetyl-CoA carboxylase carboxyl transferase subunit beta [Candidatus Poribacteria bacterium]
MSNPSPRIACRGCSSELVADELERNARVCPQCGFHHVLSARERLDSLADEGSFDEFGADLYSVDPLGFPGYQEKLRADRERTGLSSEVLTGYVSIGSNRVVIGVSDANFIMGTMGSVAGEKVTRCFELAVEAGLPVIIVSASGGGMRMQEGTIALMQMAKTSAAVMRHHRAGLVYIAVATHPTMGGSAASFVSLGDIIIAEPGAMIGFAGPRARAAIGEKMPPRLQSAESLAEHGMLDAVVPRHELRSVLIEILDFVNDRAPSRT